jgi:hypothetical protein
MHHKKFGARQIPAFRDIYTFVRRSQIWIFDHFCSLYAMFEKNGPEYKIATIGNGMLWGRRYCYNFKKVDYLNF